MKTKVMKRVVVAFLAALLVFGSFVWKGMAAGGDANRMNVVFVIDCSGSMERTDGGKLRFDALDLFMGLSTETGNYMGAVMFDDKIVLQQDIQLMDGSDAKTAMSQQLRSIPKGNDTNIGLALRTATDMLQSQGNPNLDSVIIILSDGNTDLGNNVQALNDSEIAKSEAVTAARNNGIRIFSVCLNVNGEADKDELEDISTATGGTCVEVTAPEDLRNVFRQFYEIIYSAQTVVLADTQLNDSGFLDVDFHIPMIGVEEANIIINAANPDMKYRLYRPDGTAYTDQELEQMTLHAGPSVLIKIPQPAAGDWRLHTEGVPGDQIRIDMTLNVNLSMEVVLDPDVTTMVVGDAVDVTAVVQNNGNPITDPAIYSTFSFMLHTENTATGEVNDFVMTPGNEGAVYHFTPGKPGGYVITINTKLEDIELSSSEIKIAVNSASSGGPAPVENTPPEAKVDEVLIEKKISSLAKSVDYTEDLSQYVTDAEDKELTFEFDDLITTADPDAIEIDDEDLKIDLAALNEEELIGIIAKDSEGAAATFNVRVVVKKALPIWIILVPVLLLLVIIIIVVLTAKKNNRMLRGKITFKGFNENESSALETFDGTRGKMFLRRYMDSDVDTGMDLSSVYVIASEKPDYAYLVGKGGLYTEMSPDTRSKKIRLDNGIEVTAWAVDGGDRGIKITYIADDDNF